MGRPKFPKIIELMEKEENFELTKEQYKKKTEADFPKDRYYAEKNSAVAKIAAQYGYKIKVIPLRILFVKDL